MLSRNLRRAVLDTRLSLPPTFLLPWTANLSTVSHAAESGNVTEQLVNSATKISTDKTNTIPASKLQPSTTSSQPSQPLPPPSSQSTPPTLSHSIRELLPVLQAQAPHYITAHIYDRPYLLTEGDTLRLPFLMHGVQPGDVLRLNRATNLGSRDFTLKAASSGPKTKSPTATTIQITDPTTGHLSSESHVMPDGAMAADGAPAAHFVWNQLQGRTSFLDDRFFVCRAVVMSVESEPMRIKEKTKRRQRRTKTVKSKHRFTVLRVKELRVRSLEEIEAGEVD